MMRTLAFLTAIALLGVSGAVAGLWTNRWSPSRSVQQGAERVRQVPLELGEWVGTEGTLDDQAVALAELSGYISRKYTHSRTGAVVTILVVCGRPGPISVHTPDVCYGNSGYEQTATSSYKLPEKEGAPRAEFSILDFRKQNVALPSQMRLYLAWGTKQGWSSPKQPRITFAREPVLYKMYVIREVPKLPEGAEHDPAVDLIQALMPGLHQTLFAGA
jgi:hypothetical protein